MLRLRLLAALRRRIRHFLTVIHVVSAETGACSTQSKGGTHVFSRKVCLVTSADRCRSSVPRFRVRAKRFIAAGHLLRETFYLVSCGHILFKMTSSPQTTCWWNYYGPDVFCGCCNLAARLNSAGFRDSHYLYHNTSFPCNNTHCLTPKYYSCFMYSFRTCPMVPPPPHVWFTFWNKRSF